MLISANSQVRILTIFHKLKDIQEKNRRCTHYVASLENKHISEEKWRVNTDKQTIQLRFIKEKFLLSLIVLMTSVNRFVLFMFFNFNLTKLFLCSMINLHAAVSDRCSLYAYWFLFSLKHFPCSSNLITISVSNNTHFSVTLIYDMPLAFHWIKKS